MAWLTTDACAVVAEPLRKSYVKFVWIASPPKRDGYEMPTPYA